MWVKAENIRSSVISEPEYFVPTADIGISFFRNI